MILAALLLPIAIVAVIVLVQRLKLPAFLALMLVVVGYGVAASMTFQSIGKAFGLDFVAALEQVGLLVLAGALVAALLIKRAAARSRRRGCGRARGAGRVGRGRIGAAAAGGPRQSASR